MLTSRRKPLIRKRSRVIPSFLSQTKPLSLPKNKTDDVSSLANPLTLESIVAKPRLFKFLLIGLLLLLQISLILERSLEGLTADPQLLLTLSRSVVSSKMIHILHTRFMQDQGNLTQLAWARFQLFETFCFPTIAQQTTDNTNALDLNGLAHAPFVPSVPSRRRQKVV